MCLCKQHAGSTSALLNKHLDDGCAKALNALSEVALEMINAFEELGIFNTGFFDTLRVLHELSEVCTLPHLGVSPIIRNL